MKRLSLESTTTRAYEKREKRFLRLSVYFLPTDRREEPIMETRTFNQVEQGLTLELTTKTAWKGTTICNALETIELLIDDDIPRKRKRNSFRSVNA